MIFVMFPILFKIGSITIYTYGFFLALAIFFGVFVIWKNAIKRGFQEEKFLDLVILGLVLALFGARFFHLVVFGPFNLPNLIKIWQGQKNWYGGLFTAFIFLYYYTKKRGWSHFEVGDILVIGVSLSQTIVSLGCLLSGCELRSSILNLLFYFLLFIFLSYSLEKKLLFAGVPLFGYLIFSSLFRLIIKRELLSFAVVAFAVIGLYKRWQDFKGIGRRSFLEEFKSKVLPKRADFQTWKGKEMKRIPFSGEFLKKIKAKLLERKKSLKQQEMLLEKEDPFKQTDRVQDSAELVSDTEEQLGHERILAVKKILERSKRRVVKALQKLKGGKYGVCESCGGIIDHARLAVDPTVTLCFDCERKKELE